MTDKLLVSTKKQFVPKLGIDRGFLFFSTKVIPIWLLAPVCQPIDIADKMDSRLVPSPTAADLCLSQTAALSFIKPFNLTS